LVFYLVKAVKLLREFNVAQTSGNYLLPRRYWSTQKLSAEVVDSISVKSEDPE